VDDIRSIVESAVDDTDEFYAWDHHVRECLSACCLLVSWREIVLRPLVPITGRQGEFAGAAQRVYMSATLGAGGELERIFGVRAIKRLPVPEEWEHRSTGRRLFLLPSASLRPSEMEDVVQRSVLLAKRALVLAPTYDAVAIRSAGLNEAGIETLAASDVEESLEPFTSADKTALVLANRYDGLDLPGEDCRLLILDGLPVAVNVLERFLYQRLAATALLGERMRTRFTQGVGRATRGEGDWCAVLVGSREAYDFCSRGEVRHLLHPELQGELRFGLEESRDRTADDFLGLLEVLLEHGAEWQEADAQIRELRDDAIRGTDPAAAALAGAVASEVDFTYAMSESNYPHAVERATSAAESLSGEPVASYRAWWLYQAGAAAWLAHEAFGTPGMLAHAQEQFRRAIGTGRTLHWFGELAYGDLGTDVEPDYSREDLQAAERVQERLRKIGFHGSGWQRQAAALRRRLQSDDHGEWEEGIAQLGRLLGFEASHPGGRGDPDSVWIATERQAIVWEAKVEEEPEGEIGARSVQQAAGHEQWVRVRGGLAEDAEVLVVFVSDRERLGESADLHAGEVALATLDEVRDLAEAVVATVTRVRSQGRDDDSGGVRARVLTEFGSQELLPSHILSRLGSQRLADLA
jgi:hypothetical protein